ncbi:hypothetical protein NDU88_001274 [Pleurodeles waltl]|uniref:Uncharacterized protein n=1 Tax=Pleurodeles waltl TaxID=8319 RepID=A0AAV7MK15_PLEWA|nr:hypothetical protein NDU88_001274 [Pleurodeles waltl]
MDRPQPQSSGTAAATLSPVGPRSSTSTADQAPQATGNRGPGNRAQDLRSPPSRRKGEAPIPRAPPAVPPQASGCPCRTQTLQVRAADATRTKAWELVAG